MKRLFKFLLFFLILIAAALAIAVITLSEDEPQGSNPEKAELMAERMLEAIDADAWNELRYVSWVFRGANHYLWDKHNNTVKVNWGETEVHLNIGTKDGEATVKGVQLSGEENKEAVEKAWANFCNDSFWLNAPSKIMDAGTELTVVSQEDGSEGLKVKYTNGGVTPGDSYVWTLNDDGLPISYKMWTQILPIGGLEFTWEDYQTLPGGTLVATKHGSPSFTLMITDIKGGMSLEDMR